MCFFKSDVKYFIMIINSESYRDDPLNISAIEKLKETPNNVGDLVKSLDFIAYYNQYRIN